MSDHDKLREAIRNGRRLATLLKGFSWDDAYELLPFLELVFDAAESTLPRTKMVEVWHICAALGDEPRVYAFRSREAADHVAKEWMKDSHANWCGVHITGPHQQEVPA